MKTMRIEGVIGAEGNTGEDFVRRVKDLNLEKDEELRLIVDSPGGSVFEGYSIYSKIKALPNRVTTKIEGLAASIASLIVLAGDKIEMSQVSMLMIHYASTMVQGNAEELQKNIDTLKTIDNTLVNVYQAKTGKSEDEIKAMLQQETFIDSEVALADGWIDEIVDKVAEQMAAEFKQINKTNNMGRLMDFFGLDSSVKTEDTPAVVEETVANVEEAVAEPTAAEEDAPTPTEEEVMTLESVNEKVDKLIEVVDTLLEAQNTAPSPEEAQAAVEVQVDNSFKELLATLPQTKGVVAQAVGAIDKVTKTYVAPGTRSANRMNEISNKTRLK